MVRIWSQCHTTLQSLQGTCTLLAGFSQARLYLRTPQLASADMPKRCILFSFLPGARYCKPFTAQCLRLED